MVVLMYIYIYIYIYICLFVCFCLGPLVSIILKCKCICEYLYIINAGAAPSSRYIQNIPKISPTMFRTKLVHTSVTFFKKSSLFNFIYVEKDTESEYHIQNINLYQQHKNVFEKFEQFRFVQNNNTLS